MPDLRPPSFVAGCQQCRLSREMGGARVGNVFGHWLQTQTTPPGELKEKDERCRSQQLGFLLADVLHCNTTCEVHFLRARLALHGAQSYYSKRAQSLHIKLPLCRPQVVFSRSWPWFLVHKHSQSERPLLARVLAALAHSRPPGRWSLFNLPLSRQTELGVRCSH